MCDMTHSHVCHDSFRCSQSRGNLVLSECWILKSTACRARSWVTVTPSMSSVFTLLSPLCCFLPARYIYIYICIYTYIYIYIYIYIHAKMGHGNAINELCFRTYKPALLLSARKVQIYTYICGCMYIYMYMYTCGNSMDELCFHTRKPDLLISASKSALP